MKFPIASSIRARLTSRTFALLMMLMLLLSAWAFGVGEIAGGTSALGMVAIGTVFSDDDLGKRLKSQGMIAQLVELDPGEIAAGAEGTATVAVTGLTPDHVIVCQPKADLTVGLYMRGARCAAAGTLTVDLVNTSGGAINEAAFAANLIAFPKLA